MLVSDSYSIIGLVHFLKVLILVLVDVGLGPSTPVDVRQKALSLNPCFSGCWSRTSLLRLQGEQQRVLILVLVDVGLGPEQEDFSIP